MCVHCTILHPFCRSIVPCLIHLFFPHANRKLNTCSLSRNILFSREILTFPIENIFHFENIATDINYIGATSTAVAVLLSILFFFYFSLVCSLFIFLLLLNVFLLIIIIFSLSCCCVYCKNFPF